MGKKWYDLGGGDYHDAAECWRRTKESEDILTDIGE